MSREDQYFKEGLERGKAGKHNAMGFTSSFAGTKSQEEAAQRGWEAGQAARAHAEALQEQAEADREDSNMYSSGGGGRPDGLGIALMITGFCSLFFTGITAFFIYLASDKTTAGSKPVLITVALISGVAGFIYSVATADSESRRRTYREFVWVVTSIALFLFMAPLPSVPTGEKIIYRCITGFVAVIGVILVLCDKKNRQAIGKTLLLFAIVVIGVVLVGLIAFALARLSR